MRIVMVVISIEVMVRDNTDGSEADVGAGDDDREQDGAKVKALIFLGDFVRANHILKSEVYRRTDINAAAVILSLPCVVNLKNLLLPV